MRVPATILGFVAATCLSGFAGSCPGTWQLGQALAISQAADDWQTHYVDHNSHDRQADDHRQARDDNDAEHREANDERQTPDDANADHRQADDDRKARHDHDTQHGEAVDDRDTAEKQRGSRPQRRRP